MFENPYNYMISVEQNKINEKSREKIKERVSKSIVLDLGCGIKPINGKYTACVDIHNYDVTGENIEFHQYDILSPDFFEQDFLKNRGIDYTIMNAVISNIIKYDYANNECIIENLDSVINLIENSKQNSKQVILGVGEEIKNLLIGHLDNVIIDKVERPENCIFITDAYILSI